MEIRSRYNDSNNFEMSQTRSLLSKFSTTWEKRAQVKKYNLPTELTYEIDKPDFLEELIPIKNCKAYKQLDESTKNKLLSYGWLAYNAKTIAIESKIISPVCYEIIDGHIPGATDNFTRRLIGETLTDESYHILLSSQAMNMTEKIRKISRNIFPNFDLVTKVIELENKFPEKWQKTLVRLAVAIVSEIFISDYLKCLSVSSKIVTLNRETVKSHRMDEVAHGKIFTELTKIIYRKLDLKQKKFFSSILHLPVHYFASKELSVWREILNKVCPNATDEIMEESLTEEWFDLSNINYKDLIYLADEIGINNFSNNLGK